MVQGERKKDLSNMYDLLKSVQNAMVLLIDTVLDHIKTQGLAVSWIFGFWLGGLWSFCWSQAIGNIDTENIHITFVENMLGVYKKYKLLIQEVFKSDQNFMGALDRACSSVINHKFGKPVCKSPEFLAKYCDALLRKSSKGISDSEASPNN